MEHVPGKFRLLQPKKCSSAPVSIYYSLAAGVSVHRLVLKVGEGVDLTNASTFCPTVGQHWAKTITFYGTTE